MSLITGQGQQIFDPWKGHHEGQRQTPISQCETLVTQATVYWLEKNVTDNTGGYYL